MGKSILFISKHLESASTRYRISQFVPYLKQNGWQVAHHATKKDSLSARLKLLQQMRSVDVVFIQRKLFATWYLKLIARANPNIVFDYDDAIFMNDDGSSSSHRQRQFIRTTHLAKLALAGNSYLASQSRAEKTEIFPTGLDTRRYQAKTDYSEPETLTLVWIGSRSTKKYLEQQRDMFETLGREFPNLVLRVIADFDIQFQHLKTNCVQWSSETEADQLREADIGIAPMQDDLWTRGKCGFKVIQYMASGLPVISSNTGANADIVENQTTGFLVNSIADWKNAIHALHNPQLRQTMGTAGRKRAEEHYSVAALSARLQSALTMVTEG